MTQPLYFDSASSYKKYGGAEHLDVRKYDRCWYISQAIGTGKTILEVGCGPGLVGEVLIKNGNVVFGVEPDGEAASEARRRGYREVFEGRFEDYRSDAKFNVVLFTDVLEHMERPDQALVNTHRLNPDFLVISIPNVAYVKSRYRLLLGRFDYREDGLFDKTHLRWFTLDSFKRMIETSGYRIVEVHSQSLSSRLLNPPVPTSGIHWGKAFLPVTAIIDLFPKLRALQFVIKAVSIDGWHLYPIPTSHETQSSPTRDGEGTQ
jgi:SAM-dependent methyltransferase